MAIGVTFFVIVVFIILIWFFSKIKRMRHKIWALFLIGLILFTYISFTVSLRDHDVKLNSVSGVIDAGKLYISWLGGVLFNIKSISAYAVKQNWKEYDDSVINKTTDFKDIWAKLN